MTDRELLELAAKAAGIVQTGFVEEDEVHCCALLCTNQDDCLVFWNPLEDDRDAFKLAILLEMKVSGRRAIVEHPYEPELCKPIASSYVSKGEEQDIVKATRLAIVRVAAEIGKRPSGIGRVAANVGNC